MGDKIVDGAYDAMVERITSDTNPDFMFLTYEKERLEITNFLVIPKYFYPANDRKAKPLKRKGKASRMGRL